LASLYDLIRPRQQRRRDRQAEGLGSLEVDNQLVLDRLLDRKIARPSALENLVHVGSGASIQFRNARSISHEAARLRLFPEPVDSWEPVLGGEGRDLRSLRTEHRIAQDEDAVRAVAAHRHKRRLDLGRSACFQDLKLYPKRPGCALRLSQYVAVSVGVLENDHPGHLRGDSLEQLQLLSNQLRASRG